MLSVLIVATPILLWSCASSNPAGPSPDPDPTGTIYFTSSRDGDFEIFSVGPDGGNLTQITNDTAHDQVPDISQDGTNIVWYSWDGSDDEIWTMDADGASETRLTNDPGRDWWPTWGE